MEILNSLTGLDFSNIEDFSTLTKKVLIDLASNKDLLRLLLKSVAENSHLLSLAEHFDILDKVVLYDDPSQGIRVRMHIFSKDYRDIPHNHNWSFSSLILHGSYQHYLYGDGKDWDENIDIEKLRPLMIREEKIGSIYTLDPDTLHCIEPQPYTISLMLLGPYIKERFLIADKKTNKAWWQYGFKNLTLTERQNKVMSLSYFNNLISKIEDLNLI